LTQDFKAVGRDGPFQIKPAGYHPQGGHMLDYLGGVHRFRFYVQSPQAETVLVTDLSGEERAAPDDYRFAETREELRIIKENISAYFERFSVWGALSEWEGPRTVIFRWTAYLPDEIRDDEE
jgi:hypothetical protein